jgi:hypothetical protein
MWQNSYSINDVTDEQLRRAAALGIAITAVRMRLSRGWPPERATGELSRHRLPDGERQRYERAPRGRWTRILFMVAKDTADEREVEAVCCNEGLPVPRYNKPARHSPPRRPRPMRDPFADIPAPVDEH